MRRPSAIILLAFAAPALGAADTQDFSDMLFEKMLGRVNDRLVQRDLEESSLQHAGLDNATLGKAMTGSMAVPRAMGAAAKSTPCLRYACTIPNPGQPALNRMLAGMRGDVRTFAKEGDTFPDVDVDYGFPPMKVNMKERLAGKKTIVVGLPGAFTPVWSAQQVPGYLTKQAELKAKGVDEVLIYCVNDGAVMEGWAKDQGVQGSMVTFLADTRSELTKALDLVLDAPGAMEKLGNPRCERFAMVVEDGKIKAMAVAGGDVPDEATFAEAMLEKC